uniref:Uncharacterized protein n=1 Tax=Aegilops tauschii TaxID=37682 RepID=M8BJU8_AEGTA
MSSSSSSGASAAFTPVSQQQQMASESLSSELQPPAPMQPEAPSEQLCYVHCHFCDTVLVVSVPSSSLFKTVTDEISSANPSLQLLEQHGLGGLVAAAGGRNAAAPAPLPPPPVAGGKAPEKRQRVPSAYNRFIKQAAGRGRGSGPGRQSCTRSRVIHPRQPWPAGLHCYIHPGNVRDPEASSPFGRANCVPGHRAVSSVCLRLATPEESS